MHRHYANVNLQQDEANVLALSAPISMEGLPEAAIAVRRPDLRQRRGIGPAQQRRLVGEYVSTLEAQYKSINDRFNGLFRRPPLQKAQSEKEKPELPGTGAERAAEYYEAFRMWTSDTEGPEAMALRSFMQRNAPSIVGRFDHVRRMNRHLYYGLTSFARFIMTGERVIETLPCSLGVVFSVDFKINEDEIRFSSDVCQVTAGDAYAMVAWWKFCDALVESLPGLAARVVSGELKSNPVESIVSKPWQDRDFAGDYDRYSTERDWRTYLTQLESALKKPGPQVKKGIYIWEQSRLACGSGLPIPIAHFVEDGAVLQFAWNAEACCLDVDISEEGSVEWYFRDRVGGKVLTSQTKDEPSSDYFSALKMFLKGASLDA